MEQHDTRSRGITAIDVVQKHAAASGEFADGWILRLRQLEKTTLPMTRSTNSEAATSNTVQRWSMLSLHGAVSAETMSRVMNR
ncbi:hypothetical protein RAD15_37425 [Bradyrhizobium sp. 14AA]